MGQAKSVPIVIIAHGRFCNWLRPLAGQDATDAGPVDAMQTVADTVDSQPDTLLAQQDALQRVQSVVRQLPQRQQQAFMLRVWDGMDVAGAAQAMNCSQGSAPSWLTMS